MHRVELKVWSVDQLNHSYHGVPNAPCGVESSVPSAGEEDTFRVPNAPCGVERLVYF